MKTYIYEESEDWTCLLVLWETYKNIEEFIEEKSDFNYEKDNEWYYIDWAWYSRFKIIVWEEALLIPKEIKTIPTIVLNNSLTK